MAKQFIMGNEAMGLAAIAAGVRCVAGYPGTPSTEVLETVAKHNPGDIHVEWSDNEKAALEVAAGAAFAGARCMVTMKQVGLNVATDPLMSLSYVGIQGGMVLVVADDPGPISSQTEQDTRTFGLYSKVPVFDPSSPEEAYDMVLHAFDVSEKYRTPVIVRPVTRVDHGCAVVDVQERGELAPLPGFEKDPGRWVIFPRLSNENHRKIFKERIPQLAAEESESPFNKVSGSGTKGIITSSISYEYVMEALNGYKGVKVMKVGTPFPWPEQLILSFLVGVKEVLAVEELDPYLEDQLMHTIGKYHLDVTVRGKYTDELPASGENTVEIVAKALQNYLGSDAPLLSFPEGAEEAPKQDLAPVPDLPVRPPVLCAGCSHRSSFLAVKKAMKGQDAVFTGDIGCYTLGNAAPLNMVDTCLCMGADITQAQGLYHAEPNKKYFAFIGDSTFFASGITGVINAVYNQAELTVCVLDNSTTAMTGHQPHPGTGFTMMGKRVKPVSIEKVLEGCGVEHIATVNPMELDKAIDVVKETAALPGVKAIIFRYPCAAMTPKPKEVCTVEADRCIGCFRCIREIGCPAISKEDGKAVIDPGLCTACGLCKYVCPKNAIVTVGGADHE